MAITKERAIKDGTIKGSLIIADRGIDNKRDFDDFVGQVLTIANYEKVETKKKDEVAYVVTFEEYTEYFFWATGWIKNLIETYGDEFLGTQIKVGEKEVTSNGNDFRTFEIV